MIIAIKAKAEEQKPVKTYEVTLKRKSGTGHVELHTYRGLSDQGVQFLEREESFEVFKVVPSKTLTGEEAFKRFHSPLVAERRFSKGDFLYYPAPLGVKIVDLQTVLKSIKKSDCEFIPEEESVQIAIHVKRVKLENGFTGETEIKEVHTMNGMEYICFEIRERGCLAELVRIFA